MTARAVAWKLHRWIGPICLLPFGLLLLSGVVLLLLPALPGTAARIDPVGLDRALTIARARFPDARPGLILPGSSPAREWTIAMRRADGDAVSVRFGPADGQIIGIAPSGTSWRERLLAFHNSLYLGLAGKLVILSTALGVICLGVSGFVMLRQRLRIATRTPWKSARPASSLHKWAGLIGLAVILLWATTGFLLLGFKMLGENRPMPPRAGRAIAAPAEAPAIIPIARDALRLRPGAEIQAIMPGDGHGPVSIVLLDRGAAPWAKSSTLSFSRRTGAFLPDRPVPGLMRAMIAAKSLHTGLWDYAWVRVLYLLMAILPLILTFSGVVLWWSHRKLRHARPAGATS